MFSKSTNAYGEFVRLMIVPVVLGLFAGFAGALTAWSYLASPSEPETGPIQIGRPTLSITAPLPETRLAERLRGVNVPLYPRKTVGTDAGERARVPSEAVGYAAVLTSDGWLATHQSVAGVPVMAAIGGRLFEPKSQITDPRTGIVFLKVEASALPVSGFEETDALRVGTPLYAQADSGLFAPGVFAGTVPTERKSAAPGLQSSDRFNRAFLLGRALGPHAAGGAVLTAGGNLAGIMTASGDSEAFIPMHEIRPVLAEVFRGQAPSRPVLGVHYLTLEETAFVSGEPATMKGVLVTGSRALGLPAVRASSPAAQAGLRDGDVILRVDGIEVSITRDLAEVVAAAEPGGKIHLDVVRGGFEELGFDVVLGGGVE